MRRWIITLIVLALLWCGWWLLGAFAMERGLMTWLEARRAEGWHAEVTETAVGGFPLSFTADLGGIVMTSPVDAARLEVDALQTRVPSYWPLSLQILFPKTPLRLETPAEQFFLKLTEGRARGAVSLSARLTFAELQSGAWQLNASGGNILSAQDLLATVTQAAASVDTYHITADTTALTPGDVLRQAIALPADWPRPLSTFLVDLTVGLTSDQGTRSQPRLQSLEVNKVDVAWGPLSLAASGSIAIDASGTPQGTLNLTVKNWREAYEIGKQSGVVKPELHLRYDLLLNGLSNIGGDPSTLDLTLSFRDGQTYLGRIPLGPAPVLLR